MKGTKLLGIMILTALLLTPFGAATTWTESHCKNNKTLVETTWSNETGSNETTSVVYTNPRYGCEGGAAVTPDTDYDYGLIAIITLIAFIAVNMAVAYFFPRGEYQGVKILFLFISMLGAWYLMMVTSIIAQEHISLAIFNKIYSSLNTLTEIYTWVLFFAVVIFAIYFMIGAFGLVTDDDRAGQPRNNKRP